jgi:hypothetical protein
MTPMNRSTLIHLYCQGKNMLRSAHCVGENRMIFHRLFSAVLGLVLALAGLGVAGYIQFDPKRDTLLSGAIGILVPGVLMLSAFYMAFRFLKFAANGKN